MSDRHRSGRALGSVLLLLLLLGGAGGYNYHRNWQIEQETQGPRPYKAYQTADLESLRTAYATELETVRVQLAHSKRQRSQVSRNHGSITKNVEQFADTARTSSAIRDAAANVADREGQISELDTELEMRARFGKGMARHLKLLTTI